MALESESESEEDNYEEDEGTDMESDLDGKKEEGWPQVIRLCSSIVRPPWITNGCMLSCRSS